MPSSFLNSITKSVSSVSKLSPADLTNVPKIMSSLVNFSEYLEGASFGILYFNNYSLQVSLLDFFGSLLVCYRYRHSIKMKKSWFEALIACTLMQFGGTTLTGILLGQTPSWIISHTAYPALLLAYWLTFCAPHDFFWKITKSFLIPLQIGAVISSGHAVTSWGLDKAYYNTFHTNYVRISESMLTCLLCGTFSGSGGGLLTDIFGFLRNPSFTLTQTTSIFSIDNYNITATFTRSFILAVIYYILITPYFVPSSFKGPMLNKAQGHTVIVALQLIHFLCVEVFNLDIYTQLVIQARKLFRIPNAIEPQSEQPKSDTVTTSGNTDNINKSRAVSNADKKKGLAVKGGNSDNNEDINDKGNTKKNTNVFNMKLFGNNKKDDKKIN